MGRGVRMLWCAGMVLLLRSQAATRKALIVLLVLILLHVSYSPSPCLTKNVQVRDKIKNFAQNAVGSAVPGYPCPPFKVCGPGWAAAGSWCAAVAVSQAQLGQRSHARLTQLPCCPRCCCCRSSSWMRRMQ